MDYTLSKEFSLGIKVEDSGPVGQRRFTTTIFHITVVFVPEDSDDPEQVTELELTFSDVDYNTVDETAFITALNDSLTTQNPDVTFTHFELHEGSVIATFEMIATTSKKTEVINNIAAAVNSPQGLTINYQNKIQQAGGFKVDKTDYTIPSDEEDDKEPSMVKELRFI